MTEKIDFEKTEHCEQASCKLSARHLLACSGTSLSCSVVTIPGSIILSDSRQGTTFFRNPQKVWFLVYPEGNF